MNQRTDPNNRQNSQRPQINFDDRKPAARYQRPVPRGLRDEDWTDDEFSTPDSYRGRQQRTSPAPRYDGEQMRPDAPYPGNPGPYDDRHTARYGDTYDDGYGRPAPVQQPPRQRPAAVTQPVGGRRPEPQPDDYYSRGRYNDSFDMNDRDDNGGRDGAKPKSFARRYAIPLNILYIICAAVAFGWICMLFLDYWTFHGQERVVPDARNQSAAVAMNNVRSAGLKAVITDSIFDSYAAPGTVVEQTPIPGAKIKKGGSVYLTIVSYTPKMVTVPDFYNVSMRQAKSMFEGLGLPEVQIETVPSEYEGLVLGARYNGVALSPGARIPLAARVTLQVGSGLEMLEETGAPIDSAAIDEVIEKLDID